MADRVLNKHFGGTYEAYLVLEGAEHDLSPAELAARTKDELTGIMAGQTPGAKLFETEALIDRAADNSTTVNEFMSLLVEFWEVKMDTADDDSYDFWADGLDIIDQIRNRDQLFKQPEVLRYVAKLQSNLIKSGVVGKSNSITDVVKKVYQELFEADAAYYRVPETSNAVAQTLISFQNSHKPDDLCTQILAFL